MIADEKRSELGPSMSDGAAAAAAAAAAASTPNPPAQRELLMQLVESAESKLSRCRLSPSGGGGGGQDDATNLRTRGGPTPTNDLVRQLLDRDRAAFAERTQQPAIRASDELRALRSVSPRRATLADGLPQVGAAPTLNLPSGPTTQRRHSAYLFPAYLLAAGPNQSTGSTSDDDDDDDEDLSLGSLDADADADEDEMAGAKLAPHNRNLEVVVQRQLRNSASSPSALNSATPTNPATRCSCCGHHTGGEGQRAGPRFLPSTTARQWQAHSQRPHKRHSLMDALQAGGHRLYHSVARHSQPAQEQVEWSPQEPQQNRQSQQQEQYEPLIPESGFKIVVMGTSGSGKSSIIQRFLYDSFNWRHQPTVEDTYFLEFPYLKQMINISISDTSGTYQFPAMRRLAINSSDAFILVYSVDNPKSFDYVEELRQNILEERERAYSEQASASTSSTSQSGSTSSSVAALNSTGRILGPIAQQQQQQQLHHHGRHWSLASIFSQQQQQHKSHAPSLGSTSGACSSLSSSVCSSSDSSRRSSVSAAEAALRTRRTRRPPMVIVANKCDLAPEEHLVNSDEIEALAVIDWNNGFVRASAALNLNIDDIFQQVLRQAKQPPTLTEAIVSKRRKSLPPRLPNQQQQHN